MTHPLHILADRVEGLSGPDMNVGREVLRACGWKQSVVGHFMGPLTYWSPPGAYKRGAGFNDDDFRRHDPTASLDAAMSLVPEGWAFLLDWGKYGNETSIFWEVFLQRQDDAVSRGNAEASTPALALTAACLRTIAANQELNP